MKNITEIDLIDNNNITAKDLCKRKLPRFSNLLNENIFYVGARETNSTPNIDPIAGPLNVAEVNIESI